MSVHGGLSWTWMSHEYHVWCDRNKLLQGVMGLDNLKGCIGRNKSKYTVPSHSLLPSYISLENINHKQCENGTDWMMINSTIELWKSDIAYLFRVVLIWFPKEVKTIFNLSSNISLNKNYFQMKEVKNRIFTAARNHTVNH